MAVIPDDLSTYLGVAVDPDRAQLLIDMAIQLCQSVITPLPTGADVVVLDVVARAYTNPQNVQAQTVGPYTATYGGGNGGLWLTRQNKATLRRLSGSGSAFSINTMPTGVNCVQALTVSATSGTFTLSFGGSTTQALAYNATAGQIQTALEALGSITPGNISVTGSGPFVLTFINNLGTTPLSPVTVDSSGLAGSSSVSVVKPGVKAPGQGLAYWNYDYYNGGGSALPWG